MSFTDAAQSAEGPRYDVTVKDLLWRGATLGDLEGWLDRVIDAPDLDTVFGPARPS